MNTNICIFQEDLIARGVCTESQSQTVINDQCLPLVGDRQTNFEQALEEMDVSIYPKSSHKMAII